MAKSVTMFEDRQFYHFQLYPDLALYGMYMNPSNKNDGSIDPDTIAHNFCFKVDTNTMQINKNARVLVPTDRSSLIDQLTIFNKACSECKNSHCDGCDIYNGYISHIYSPVSNGPLNNKSRYIFMLNNISLIEVFADNLEDIKSIFDGNSKISQKEKEAFNECSTTSIRNTKPLANNPLFDMFSFSRPQTQPKNTNTNNRKNVGVELRSVLTEANKHLRQVNKLSRDGSEDVTKSGSYKRLQSIVKDYGNKIDEVRDDQNKLYSGKTLQVVKSAVEKFKQQPKQQGGSSKLTKTNQKIKTPRGERVVYEGRRGAKYVKLNGQVVNVKTLKR